MFSKLFLLPKPILLSLFLKDLGHIVADTAPYFKDQRFENGIFSSNIVAPYLNIITRHSRCDDGSYIMFNSRGFVVVDDARGPIILDSLGILDFWAGNDALNLTYKEVAKISAASGTESDLHEFRFTEDGTALIAVYDVYPADLTVFGGSQNGCIRDSLFREINIENGELIFQLRALEHYTLTDSYHSVDDRGSRGDPWDFFRIAINGTTGSVIWVLGGRRNEFIYLSEGRATDFAYQHVARWHDNYTSISLFNNSAQAPNQEENAQFSRAMKVAIDTKNMTATLSQGSMQILPNGDVPVGYGYDAAFTEFAPNGVMLCDTHLGLPSYRVMKFNWTGHPTTKPSLVIVDDVAYVSWNESSDGDDDDDYWQPVINAAKAGFETRIELSRNLGSYITVAAVDIEGRMIGASEAFKYEQTQIFDTLQLSSSDTRPLILSMGFGWVIHATRRTWG
ncbi:hypothetical protein V2W45_1466864 [Cenococcum geophilum]